ncbi:MAG: N-acetylmuramoyl-L-alanine amidase [Bacteroidota bacterium]
MRAIFLLTTIWIAFSSFDLPIVNSHFHGGGKCNQAEGNSAQFLVPPDSVTYVITPEFRLADPGNYRLQTVVIDPGHGGHDPGCLGHSTREKHIVLGIGKKLAAGLKAQYPNINVIMTRSTDVFVPLHERASLATDNKADLFISIHCNAFSRASATGTETYVLGLHATNENLEVAKRENEAILLEDNYQQNYGYDPNSPEAHIMFSMFQNAFLEQSISFAEKVQGQAKVHTGLKDRGVKQAGFLVLRYATMPSVLVETGYLTNRNDEAYLMTDGGQQSMADALLDAFTEYKREMEKTEAATVAYQEIKKPVQKPLAYQAAAPTSTGQQSARSTNVTEKKIEINIDEEVEKAKKWGLEISPPGKKTENDKKTNVSPTRKTKITPNVPVNETERQVGSKEETTDTTIKEEKSSASTAAKDVHFCIQLAASPTLLNVNVGKWTRISQTVEVITEGKLYKYQVRNFDSFKAADEVKSQLRSKGFHDAFVVAYKDGQRIDPRKLR